MSTLICHVITTVKLGFMSIQRDASLCSSYSSTLILFLENLMDPVIIVSGNWIKKNRYVFQPDSRGCIVLQTDEKTTLDELANSVLDDYGLNEWSHQIQLSYIFSNKALKTMAHDTPPVYVSNTRQLQIFLSLRKIEKLRLCVEITKVYEAEVSDGEISRKDEDYEAEVSEVESRYEDYEEVYDGLSLEEEHDDNENNFSSILDGSKQKDVEESEEDDEFDSRFDMFDDSDGASSEDDNFSSYDESPAEDEDSPTLPPKKRSKNWWMGGSRGDPSVLRVEMSSLNLAVGQRYESKAELVRRLKLLSVRDKTDYDVEVSNSDLLIVRCWVGGCLWRVRASTQGDSPAFYVRIYDSLHTCSITERSNRCRQATPDILGQLYKDYLGDVGPAVRPSSVGIAITKQFGLKVILRFS